MVTFLLVAILVVELSVFVATVRDWKNGNDASPWDFHMGMKTWDNPLNRWVWTKTGWQLRRKS